MRSLSVAAATIACSIILGCTMQAGAERQMGRNSLTEDALRGLFSNVYVEPVRPADDVIVGPWPGEIFQSDGVYVRIPHITRIYGTFYVRRSLVCIQGDGFRPHCRQVIPLGNGTYTLIDVSDGSSMQVTITSHR